MTSLQIKHTSCMQFNDIWHIPNSAGTRLLGALGQSLALDSPWHPHLPLMACWCCHGPWYKRFIGWPSQMGHLIEVPSAKAAPGQPATPSLPPNSISQRHLFDVLTILLLARSGLTSWVWKDIYAAMQRCTKKKREEMFLFLLSSYIGVFFQILVVNRQRRVKEVCNSFHMSKSYFDLSFWSTRPPSYITIHFWNWGNFQKQIVIWLRVCVTVTWGAGDRLWYYLGG